MSQEAAVAEVAASLPEEAEEVVASPREEVAEEEQAASLPEEVTEEEQAALLPEEVTEEEQAASHQEEPRAAPPSLGT